MRDVVGGAAERGGGATSDAKVKGDTSAALHNLNSTSPWLSSETLKHKVHSKFMLLLIFSIFTVYICKISVRDL